MKEGLAGFIAGALGKEAVENGIVCGNERLNSQVFSGGASERIGMYWVGLTGIMALLSVIVR